MIRRRVRFQFHIETTSLNDIGEGIIMGSVSRRILIVIILMTLKILFSCGTSLFKPP